MLKLKDTSIKGILMFDREIDTPNNQRNGYYQSECCKYMKLGHNLSVKQTSS